MERGEGQKRAIEELNAALGAKQESQKDFHVRQALQLIELDGDNASKMNTE